MLFVLTSTIDQNAIAAIRVSTDPASSLRTMKSSPIWATLCVSSASSCNQNWTIEVPLHQLHFPVPPQSPQGTSFFHHSSPTERFLCPWQTRHSPRSQSQATGRSARRSQYAVSSEQEQAGQRPGRSPARESPNRSSGTNAPQPWHGRVWAGARLGLTLSSMCWCQSARLRVQWGHTRALWAIPDLHHGQIIVTLSSFRLPLLLVRVRPIGW